MLKRFTKHLFFYLIMFIILLFFFELILNLGGYFYFYIYSNWDNPKVEEDAFRILFLGESTTAGASINNPQEDAYPTQVERILQRHYPNKKIKCYNRGIGAIETTAILRNLNRNMIKYKPYLVIIMVGANDRPSSEGTHVLKSRYLKSNIYRLISSMIDTFKLDLNYTDKRDFIFRYKLCSNCDFRISFSQFVFNLDSITRTVHSYGSEIWFVGYLQPDARGRVNPMLQNITKKDNITYVGDYPEVDFEINRSLFADDGWHPNEEGHRIIAEAIAKRVIWEGIVDRWDNNEN